MIEQATISDSMTQNFQQVRYDTVKEILYHQNRSYDKSMTLDEYKIMKARTIKSAKEKHFQIKFETVGENASWKVKNEEQ